MQITISQSDLSFGIQTVQRAVSTRSTLPVLSGILLQATNGKLRLAATDLELGIECLLPAKIIAEGAIVLPARYLGEIVRKIPAGDISITVDELNATAAIRWDRSDYTIHGFGADQFPVLPQADGQLRVELDQNVFRNLIRQTIFAASHDETRAILTGALVEIDGQDVRMVTTDGVRIAFGRGALSGGRMETKVSFVVPGRTLNELGRLLYDEEGERLRLARNENQLFLDLGTIKVVSRLLDGTFPNCQQLIPAEYRTVARINTTAFRDACERASLITRDASNGIKLQFQGQEVVITANAPEVGKVYEEIDAEIDGDPVNIAFNARYLIEGLRVIDSEEITFSLTGPFGPVAVRSSDNDNYLYIALPLRSL